MIHHKLWPDSTCFSLHPFSDPFFRLRNSSVPFPSHVPFFLVSVVDGGPTSSALCTRYCTFRIWHTLNSSAAPASLPCSASTACSSSPPCLFCRAPLRRFWRSPGWTVSLQDGLQRDSFVCVRRVKRAVAGVDGPAWLTTWLSPSLLPIRLGLRDYDFDFVFYTESDQVKLCRVVSYLPPVFFSSDPYVPSFDGVDGKMCG